MQPIDVAFVVAIAAGGLFLVVWVVAWGRSKLGRRKSRPGDSLAAGVEFQGTASPRSRQPAPKRAGKVVGQVRAFKEFHETERTNFFPDRNIIVWNFYLERYVGNERQMPVPVQMRGVSFSSVVADGDEVELSLGWGLGKGYTARPRAVMNLTSGARVIARQGRTFMEVLAAVGNVVKLILSVCFLLLLIGCCLWLVTNGAAPILDLRDRLIQVVRPTDPP